jgi:ribosomal protein L37AE/L43A
MRETMRATQFTKPVARPTECPECRGKMIDTLAKVITVDTCWRCRQCEATWTIASLAISTGRGRDTRR